MKVSQYAQPSLIKKSENTQKSQAVATSVTGSIAAATTISGGTAPKIDIEATAKQFGLNGLQGTAITIKAVCGLPLMAMGGFRVWSDWVITSHYMNGEYQPAIKAYTNVADALALVGGSVVGAAFFVTGGVAAALVRVGQSL